MLTDKTRRGGTVLLTLFSVSGVQEIDATGKEVWRFDGR